MIRSVVFRSSIASVGLAAAFVLTAAPARATVEGMLQTAVAYAHPELEGYCYAEVPVSAEIGIPPASVAEGAVAPAYVLRSGSSAAGLESVELAGRTYVNINAAAELGGVVHEYVSDSFDGDTLVYEAKLDVSALAAARGDTVEGRAQTIVQAKLALLAMARSLQALSASGLFSLRLELVGLPDQSDLPGAALHPTTQYPYTGGSPLLADYEAELFAAECPLATTFAAKADELGAGAPTPAPVDDAPKPKKCSISAAGEPSGHAAAVPWLLLAGALAARRRRRGG